MPNFSLTTATTTEAIAAISIGQQVIPAVDVSALGILSAGWWVIGTYPCDHGVGAARLSVQAQNSDPLTQLQVRVFNLTTGTIILSPSLQLSGGVTLLSQRSTPFTLITNNIYQVQARSLRSTVPEDNFSVIQAVTFV